LPKLSVFTGENGLTGKGSHGLRRKRRKENEENPGQQHEK
jgi:hypothetical protein